MLVIDLNQEQCEALTDARDALAKMESQGKPGMVVAQIFGNHMKVGVIDHDKAVALQVAFGAKAPGTTARTAYDSEVGAGDTPMSRLFGCCADGEDKTANVELTGAAPAVGAASSERSERG